MQNLVDLHLPWFFVFVSVNFFHSFIPWSMHDHTCNLFKLKQTQTNKQKAQQEQKRKTNLIPCTASSTFTSMHINIRIHLQIQVTHSHWFLDEAQCKQKFRSRTWYSKNKRMKWKKEKCTMNNRKNEENEKARPAAHRCIHIPLRNCNSNKNKQ